MLVVDIPWNELARRKFQARSRQCGVGKFQVKCANCLRFLLVTIWVKHIGPGTPHVLWWVLNKHFFERASLSREEIDKQTQHTQHAQPSYIVGD